MKTIVKNLILMKQLYLNSYSETFREDISCIGHFDAIKIMEPEDTDETNNLYLTKGNKNLSNLWNMIAKVDKELTGKYSAMSIGLFKYVQNEEDEKKETLFWEDIYNMRKYYSLIEEYKKCSISEKKEELKKRIYNDKKILKYPFYCICLLKTTNLLKIKELMVEINSIEKFFDKSIKITTYNTYDHADLITIIKGQCILAIQQAIYYIENIGKILYVDTILGAVISPSIDNSSFLLTPQIINKEEKIGNLTINISSGSDEKTRIFFKKFEPQNKKRAYSLGVDNNNFEIFDITNEMFYKILNENLEHNKYETLIFTAQTNINFYINPIINFWKEKNVLDIEINTYEKNKFMEEFLSPISNGNNWCLRIINKIKDKFKYTEVNDIAHTRYMVFLKIIIALSQYESNVIGSDLFELILPVISYYCELFLLKEKNNESLILKEDIANLFTTFDDTLNRIIHTEHKFMMIPGYNGMLFDIPIKLYLLYLSFMYKTAEILSAKDCLLIDDKLPPHRILLIPSMEDTPTTFVDECKRKDLKKVVFVNIPQKHLYQPRSLCIILTHELAHYVGNNLRLRKIRLECVIRIILNLLYDKIFISYENSFISKKTYIINGVKLILDIIKDIYDDDTTTDEEKVVTAFYKYLSSFNGIYSSNNNISLTNCKIDDLNKNMPFFLIFTRENIIEIYSNLREILADLCAIILLENSFLDYIEAYRVSCGTDINFENNPDIDRIAVVINVLTQNCKIYNEEWEKILLGNFSNIFNGYLNNNIINLVKTFGDIRQYILERKTKKTTLPNSSQNVNIASYQSTWDIENLYATKCYQEILDTISTYNEICKNKNNLFDIRNIYNFFRTNELGEDNYNKKLELINQFILDYKNIAKEIKKDGLDNLFK